MGEIPETPFPLGPPYRKFWREFLIRLYHKDRRLPSLHGVVSGEFHWESLQSIPRTIPKTASKILQTRDAPRNCLRGISLGILAGHSANHPENRIKNPANPRRSTELSPGNSTGILAGQFANHPENRIKNPANPPSLHGVVSGELQRNPCRPFRKPSRKPHQKSCKPALAPRNCLRGTPSESLQAIPRTIPRTASKILQTRPRSTELSPGNSIGNPCRSFRKPSRIKNPANPPSLHGIVSGELRRNPCRPFRKPSRIKNPANPPSLHGIVSGELRRNPCRPFRKPSRKPHQKFCKPATLHRHAAIPILL